MNRKQKAKNITLQSLLAILGIAFGILITAQWRSLPTRVTNPTAPYISLKSTSEDLYSEQDQLKEMTKDLQSSIDRIQKEQKNVILSDAQLRQLSLQKAQAGLTKLNGPGVIVVLDDSKGGSANEDSIVHAADLRDTVNLLWGSGAEAISVNGQRVTINTAIDCIVNTIMVNNVRISAPFQIEAIGKEDLMYQNLVNKNILIGLYERRSKNGLIFNISKNNNITVPVYDGSFDLPARTQK